MTSPPAPRRDAHHVSGEGEVGCPRRAGMRVWGRRAEPPRWLVRWRLLSRRPRAPGRPRPRSGPSSRFMTRTPVASRPWDEISRTAMRMSVPPDDDDEDLVVEADHERGDHDALLGRELDAPHALAAAALAVELVELGALAVAGVGDDEDARRRRGRRRRTRPRRSARSFMPRTPAAARPMGRTSSSVKRMVMPLRATMKMSSSPLVGMTRTSSSPSLQVDGDEAGRAATSRTR